MTSPASTDERAALIETAARALREAQEQRTAIAPLTSTFENIDVSVAYAIQQQNIALRLADGDLIRGHKVGLSSRAMQQMLGVTEPDFGHLLSSMFYFEGEAMPAESLMQPRAEIEVAFVLGRPLVGPGVTVADVLRATEFVLPSIEVVDSRIRDWKLTLCDTVADNASSGAVVLGGSPTLLTDVDVRLIGATLRSNGRLRETGVSGAVLSNPAVAVAWLANTLSRFETSLEPGHVILPGSCTRMIPIEPGDVIRADFDRLGSVSIAMTGKGRHS
jgi:2-keto-4-pentenoate hydratase